jgi:isocitrate dehydrogenase kinase/phosphatase
MPESTRYEDELADQPWFSVAENDIFPEEFRKFLWFPAPLRRVMEEHHSRLFQWSFGAAYRSAPAPARFCWPTMP